MKAQLSTEELLEKLITYSDLYNHFSIHVSNNSACNYDLIAAFGAKKIIKTVSDVKLNDSEWKFGLMSYDLKNQFENLISQHKNEHHLYDFYFFIPEIIITQKKGELKILPKEKEDEIVNMLSPKKKDSKNYQTINLKCKLSKEEYIKVVTQLKKHIQNGDIYEINYCINYYCNNVDLNAKELFIQLNTISEAPFASFTRIQEHYIICSSPERFICKLKNNLITEPVKGTAPRSTDEKTDKKNKTTLLNDPKEINENVMIVDVSRNDLSKIAKKSTVEAIELFKAKTYKQVHQLVSKVSCELHDNCSFESIIKSTFPPASMTGAPKIRAMQLIDDYETFRRGAYSGSVGFIDDKGDFDFNVVIRSIIYNSNNKYLSYSTGSAITSKCNPEQEYEECLLKASAMEKVLKSNK